MICNRDLLILVLPGTWEGKEADVDEEQAHNVAEIRHYSSAFNKFLWYMISIRPEIVFVFKVDIYYEIYAAND